MRVVFLWSEKGRSDGFVNQKTSKRLVDDLNNLNLAEMLKR